MAVLQGPFYETVGRRLRDARRAEKFSQARLAHSVGISRSSLANIEAGRQPVYLHVLVRIAEQLGKPAVDLMPSATPSDNPQTEPQFGRLSSPKQHWIIRVMQSGLGDRKGANGTEVLSSEAAGEGTPKQGARKRSPRTHR